MRTTVRLDPDTAAAVAQIRQARGIGVSEAVNEFIRRALLLRGEQPRYVQHTRPMGLSIDVSNVAEALESLDGVDNR